MLAPLACQQAASATLQRIETEMKLTNFQLYLAIGIPTVMSLLSIGVNITLYVHLSSTMSARLLRIEDRLDNVIGALNALDKRVTVIEVRLGIAPE
jgi:hypothetical protein